MGVIEGRAEHLTARDILESRGNPPPHLHFAGFDRLGRPEPRQRGAKGAQQENRFDHVAAGLLDGQRREFAIVQRALRHHPIDTKAELLRDLRQRDLRDFAIAATLMRQQPMSVLDGAFASLDRNIHPQPSFTASRVVRGMATTAASDTSTISTPRGNSAWLAAN